MSEQNASKLPKLDRDEATSTSRKRNAFSELMSPKPKQRSLPTQMDKPTKAAFKQFGDGLGIYIQDPKAHASQVVLENSDFVVIHDLFPKASIHLLILPRDAGKYRQHPFEAFEDSEFLAKVRKQAFDVKSLAAKELRRKFGKNSAQDQDRERAMQSDDVDAELPPGRDWESEIMVGIHAHPSMNHLHIHVISKDRVSDCLKHRKHYNSFSTPFFVPLDDFPLDEQDVRRHPGQQGYLKSNFICWKCGRDFGNAFAKLKEHLVEEFEEWKKL